MYGIQQVGLSHSITAAESHYAFSELESGGIVVPELGQDDMVDGQGHGDNWQT